MGVIMADTEQEKIKKARENIGNWFGWFDINIARANVSVEFLFEDQWSQEERRDYHDLRRPTLQFNKLYAYYKQIIGEQRQNTPNISLRAKDKDVNQQIVDLTEGLVRTIAYNSKNAIVYQTAFENALGRGYGAIQIKTDYESPNSFNQEIKLEAVEDARRAFFDPNALKPTKEDGEFCGVTYKMAKDKFTKLYPDIDYPRSFSTSYGDYEMEWITKDTIILCDYYYKKWFDKTIVQLEDGKTVDADKVEEYLKENYPKGRKPKIENQRKTKDYKIIYQKLIYNQIVEEKEMDAKWLPIVFVDGDSYFIRGRQYTKPFILYAMDAQRFLNVLVSNIAQAIKTGHVGKWVVDPKVYNNQQTKNVIQNPERASVLPMKTGEYNYIPPSELPMSQLNLLAGTDATFEALLGRYGTVRGADSNEQSGIAVAHKVRQGNISTFSYFDNLNRAVEQVGRVILDLTPIIYDTERDVIITGEDGKQRVETINQAGEFGQPVNPIKQVPYEIEVEAGSSFVMQKQENLQQLTNMMASIMQISPDSAAVLLPEIAKNLDLENTNQIVDLLTKTLVGYPSQQVISEQTGIQPPPQQANPQQQMAMQMQQVEMETKQEEAQAKMMDSRAKMVDAARRMHDSESQYHTANVKADAEIGKAKLDYMGKQQDMYHKGLERENEQLKNIVGSLSQGLQY